MHSFGIVINGFVSMASRTWIFERHCPVSPRNALFPLMTIHERDFFVPSKFTPRQMRWEGGCFPVTTFNGGANYVY